LDAEGHLREPRDVAYDEFKRIYETHQPEPLPDEAIKEMDSILAAANRTAEKLED